MKDAHSRNTNAIAIENCLVTQCRWCFANLCLSHVQPHTIASASPIIVKRKQVRIATLPYSGKSALNKLRPSLVRVSNLTICVLHTHKWMQFLALP